MIVVNRTARVIPAIRLVYGQDAWPSFLREYASFDFGIEYNPTPPTDRDDIRVSRFNVEAICGIRNNVDSNYMYGCHPEMGTKRNNRGRCERGL